MFRPVRDRVEAIREFYDARSSRYVDGVLARADPAIVADW